jgi:hypothetical protein
MCAVCWPRGLRQHGITMDEIRADSLWFLVAHAHLRFRKGIPVVGAPASDRYVPLPGSGGVLMWWQLAQGASVATLAESCSLPTEDVIELVGLLVQHGLVAAHPPAAPALEFHDAIAHARSRGRTDEGFGQWEGPPLERAPHQGQRVDLPSVATDIGSRDAPFAHVVDVRRSSWSWSPTHLSLEQLSEFLARSARRRPGSEPGSYPYPYAGPDGSTQIAIAAGRVAGLQPALYLYDPVGHSLVLVPPRPSEAEARLPVGQYLQTVAHGHHVGDRHPAALLLVLSDLELMSSTYRGVSYANTLRTTGAVLATASLCATAMGLHTTILGLAAEDDFLNFYAESLPHLTTTGELAVGVAGDTDRTRTLHQ